MELIYNVNYDSSKREKIVINKLVYNDTIDTTLIQNI